MKVKLSSTQIWVLELMSNGWELGHSKGYSPRFWLQKNGVGKGGESKSIAYPTFTKLLALKLICITQEGYPVDRYSLTDIGKTIKSSLTPKQTP